MPLPRSKMSSQDADHKNKKNILSRWKAKVIIKGSHWPQGALLSAVLGDRAIPRSAFPQPVKSSKHPPDGAEVEKG